MKKVGPRGQEAPYAINILDWREDRVAPLSAKNSRGHRVTRRPLGNRRIRELAFSRESSQRNETSPTLDVLYRHYRTMHRVRINIRTQRNATQCNAPFPYSFSRLIIENLTVPPPRPPRRLHSLPLSIFLTGVKKREDLRTANVREPIFFSRVNTNSSPSLSLFFDEAKIAWLR